ncbi:hypothetical protein B0H65DRAFT_447379 [Neurospora tetraspora]|uniref:Uncharacterized protein n=1 Tax=Neurospora tetraspora TaxID=94610 RepID=A0AAE0JM82_9PEZI|nr:hypothetical protein B0H65DRAFT_447379 [Neurospora tetraspora]
MPNPSSVWTNSRPDSQTHNHRIKHSAYAHGSLRIGRTWVGAHLNSLCTLRCIPQSQSLG